MTNSTKNSKSLNQAIKVSFQSLKSKKSFANFSLKFSEQEEIALNNLSIATSNAYDNFGNLTELTSELKDFLNSLGQNNFQKSESIALLVSKLADEVITAFEKETAWVTVRASVPTNLWDTPRWHSDGYYYSPYEGPQYKVAITLKGPSTLFNNVSQELREKFQTLQFDPENREKIAELLGDANSISTSPAAVFIVGDKSAAIHSEPPIHIERLFLSILPGNKNEIEELYNNWHPKDN